MYNDVIFHDPFRTQLDNSWNTNYFLFHTQEHQCGTMMELFEWYTARYEATKDVKQTFEERFAEIFSQ